MKLRTSFFIIFIVPLFLWAQSDLFFSEYVEGSSYNKAIEIFNPTDQSIDLSGYLLKGTSNVSSEWEYEYPFPAGVSVAPGGTFVFCDGQASDPIKALSDWVTSGYECGYNGNDSRGLFKQGVLIDVIGNPINPSEEMHSVAGTSSGLLDHTIIRKSSVTMGNTDWVSSSGTNADDSEWIVNAKDDISDLSKHTFDGGEPSTGDGEGSVAISPSEVKIDTTLDFEFTLTGVADFLLTDLKIAVDPAWSWSGNVSDVVLSGIGFSAAVPSVIADTIFITSAGLTDSTTGGLILQNMTAPSEAGVIEFSVFTAVSGGTLTEISTSPKVFVTAPAQLVTIEEIQNNFNAYNGQAVIVEAVVAIGVNIARTDRCDAFVQDASGRGINLSEFSTDFPDLARGNLVRIEGIVSEYSGTTQIGTFTTTLISTGNEVPGVAKVSTLEAGNLDYEGTMIETSGIVSDLAEGIGGGTNITINDGTGDIQMRIWDTSGLNFSAFAVGDTIGVRGIIDQYNGSPQMLLGYQEDIFKSVITGNSDGHGFVSVSPDSVGSADVVDLTINFEVSGSDTLAQVEFVIPDNWQWAGGTENVQLTGSFSTATVLVNASIILLSDMEITSAQEGVLTILNLTAPDADTSSVFNVRTASNEGTLTKIEQNAVILVGEGTSAAFISIQDARDRVGSVVTVKGVITIGSGILRTDMTTAYIQDESGYGLNVFWYGVIDEDIKRGNLVLLKGMITEYDGVLEIEDYTATVIKTGVAIPGIRKLSTEEASTTAYVGSFIEITGSITGTSSGGGGTNLFIDDGSGEVTVRVWDTTNLDVSGYAIGEFVTIRGVVGVYNSAGQILLGYEEDIFRPQFNGSPVSLTVEPHPFAPDQGESIKIEFSAGAENSHITVRIFDLAGRLVTTLKDGTGLPFPTKIEWDGLDRLGEYVPLGSYLCHLDVVNEDTGKRTVKLAPIVVGTVLR